jgi:hypothetical protein
VFIMQGSNSWRSKNTEYELLSPLGCVLKSWFVFVKINTGGDRTQADQKSEGVTYEFSKTRVLKGPFLRAKKVCFYIGGDTA